MSADASKPGTSSIAGTQTLGVGQPSLLDTGQFSRHRGQLGPDAGQGFVVPMGVVHRTRAPRRTVILMVEKAGVVPTGD